MKWSFAYNAASESATVSNPTSEQGPDGLAANVVVRDGTSHGPSWVGTAGATSKGCDFTLSVPILPGYVVVVNPRYSAAAVPKLWHNHQADTPVELCTLAKCSPANIWVGKPSGASGTNLSYTVSDAGAPSTGLETPLILFGTRVDITTFSVGRLSRGYTAHDLSTRQGGQLGAVWTCAQRRQFRQQIQVMAQDATGGLAALRALWAAVGLSGVVCSFLDFDDPTHYGNTNVGFFDADLTEAIEPGLVTNFPLTVVEMVG